MSANCGVHHTVGSLAGAATSRPRPDYACAARCKREAPTARVRLSRVCTPRLLRGKKITYLQALAHAREKRMPAAKRTVWEKNWCPVGQRNSFLRRVSIDVMKRD